MKDLKQKKGWVSFSKGLLDDMPIELAKMIFSNFYPLSIDNDMLYLNGIIKFYGYSEHFEEIKEATVIPEYIITIHSDDKGIPKSIEFDKN